VQPKKPTIVVIVCVAIAILIASGQYVHRGYLGVVESGNSLRLLDHGLHLKAPWQRTTIYPIQCREVHVEALAVGSQGQVHFAGILLLSVATDTIPALHMEYSGAYLDSLVSPAIGDYILGYGEAFGIWDERYEGKEVAEALADHLDSELHKHGINVYQVWLRSLTVAER
jgi:hypothetical protein